jgi:2-iminobutanoate/2-iminopropanoate deaminase
MPYPATKTPRRNIMCFAGSEIKSVTPGSSLENVPKCNVYCTSVEKFAAVNAIYSRYFPKNPPARIFVNVPAWLGHFDIEIDCVAVV